MTNEQKQKNKRLSKKKYRENKKILKQQNKNNHFSHS